MRIALFDYGVGNIHSLKKALEGGGATVFVTQDWDEALKADGLVLPGVGAFSAAVEALPADKTAIREALEAGLPCLGICLGMQILFPTSEEGPGEGIGFILGRVRRLESRIIPQMGWNEVAITGDEIFRDTENLVAYFANSYRFGEPAGVAFEEKGWRVAWSDHGGRFVAAAEQVGLRRGHAREAFDPNVLRTIRIEGIALALGLAQRLLVDMRAHLHVAVPHGAIRAGTDGVDADAERRGQLGGGERIDAAGSDAKG